MSNVYDVFVERGFIEQSTNAEEVRELLSKPPVTFYIGFDATADSLHVGHFIQIIVMMHMQRAGHRPLALMGGGTTMVGDPSGRSDMRKMLTAEDIDNNIESFKRQMSRFLDFGEGKAMIVNNADWLRNLNYIEFLRDYGRFFSVNKMLTAECYKQRLEKGLTFLEFNYMLMQAYDFLELNRRYDCMIEFGGNDQWSNILAGADLIRRVNGKPAHALTFKLLTTSEGKKMGKTERGALWIDADKTPPYDFFQYWRNINDADVEKCLALLTFIPMDEVRALAAGDVNQAKERLAWEVTALVHGREAADSSLAAARALFGGGSDMANMPSSDISAAELEAGMNVLQLLSHCGLIKSNSEGRQLIKDGGVYLNGERVAAFDQAISAADFPQGRAMLRKGKKVYHKVELK